MRVALIDEYSQEELEQIVNQSFSYYEVVEKLGYSAYSSSQIKTVRSRLEKFDISTDHFTWKPGVKRTQDNVFCENSTAHQHTLRKWYKKINHSEYKCAICGQEPFWQGKELTLILDHINGINNDDRLENLRWVCPNCNQQLDTTNGKNKKNLKKKHYCIDCGKEINLKSVRCNDCNSIYQQNIAIDNKPVTRNELKNLIRTNSFISIGKMFNVTDNAIRKWCDLFNLPRKSSEIKKITDEEWENI